MKFNYNRKMGIEVDGHWIPDVSEWSYQVGDLDSSGSRDATGLLHRAKVATKINYEFTWNALEWEMLERILNLVHEEKFVLQAPDPRNFRQMYIGYYYVGDRTGDAKYYWEDTEEKAVFTLKLKFIEY